MPVQEMLRQSKQMHKAEAPPQPQVATPAGTDGAMREKEAPASAAYSMGADTAQKGMWFEVGPSRKDDVRLESPEWMAAVEHQMRGQAGEAEGHQTRQQAHCISDKSEVSRDAGIRAKIPATALSPARMLDKTVKQQQQHPTQKHKQQQQQQLPARSDDPSRCRADKTVRLQPPPPSQQQQSARSDGSASGGGDKDNCWRFILKSEGPTLGSEGLTPKAEGLAPADHPSGADRAPHQDVLKEKTAATTATDYADDSGARIMGASKKRDEQVNGFSKGAYCTGLHGCQDAANSGCGCSCFCRIAAALHNQHMFGPAIAAVAREQEAARDEVRKLRGGCEALGEAVLQLLDELAALRAERQNRQCSDRARQHCRCCEHCSSSKTDEAEGGWAETQTSCSTYARPQHRSLSKEEQVSQL
jgi:hypothetical protein